MVNAVASPHVLSQNEKSTPLLPPHSENVTPRRAKPRGVASRYLSLSTSTTSSSNSASSINTMLPSISSGASSSLKRSQSPMLGRKAAATTPKNQQRAMSAERRRPAAATLSSSEKVLVTSMRSLSVSFQGESISVPVSKIKPPPTTVGTPEGVRKGTPERRKSRVTPVSDSMEKGRENSRPTDQQQHLWPGRLHSGSSSFLARSLDYVAERVQTSGADSALTELRKSVVSDGSSRNKVGAKFMLENKDADIRGINELDGGSILDDSVNSDVSSESNASGNVTPHSGRSRELVVPTRIWQDRDSPVSICGISNRPVGFSKLIAAKKFQNNSPLSSPREGSSSRGWSPLPGVVRSASPSKALTSRAGLSRTDSNTCSSPSMFCFSVNLKKGKLGESRIAYAHDLRLLYNRLLQWRLANARVENTLLEQKHTAERTLYDAWVSTSDLRDWVNAKRTELQLLRHNLKLYHVLKEQEPHLECWALFDRDHCNSVSGATAALKASTLRLPIIGGAKADLHKVQEAISSAVDTMQGMASPVCSLLAKVEQMNSMASEFSNLSSRGIFLLDKWKNLLSTTFIPLQVMHCSLRTHLIQVQQATTEKRP